MRVETGEKYAESDEFKNNNASAVEHEFEGNLSLACKASFVTNGHSFARTITRRAAGVSCESGRWREEVRSDFSQIGVAFSTSPPLSVKKVSPHSFAYHYLTTV